MNSKNRKGDFLKQFERIDSKNFILNNQKAMYETTTFKIQKEHYYATIRSMLLLNGCSLTLLDIKTILELRYFRCNVSVGHQGFLFGIESAINYLHEILSATLLQSPPAAAAEASTTTATVPSTAGGRCENILLQLPNLPCPPPPVDHFIDMILTFHSKLHQNIEHADGSKPGIFRQKESDNDLDLFNKGKKRIERIIASPSSSSSSLSLWSLSPTTTFIKMTRETKIGDQIKERIKNLFQSRTLKRMHPINQAAFIHHVLISIHPFEHGDMEVAQMMMNYFLILRGYPAISFSSTMIPEYLKHLNTAHKYKNDVPFVDFIATVLESTIENLSKSYKDN